MAGMLEAVNVRPLDRSRGVRPSGPDRAPSPRTDRKVPRPSGGGFGAARPRAAVQQIVAAKPVQEINVTTEDVAWARATRRKKCELRGLRCTALRGAGGRELSKAQLMQSFRGDC